MTLQERIDKIKAELVSDSEKIQQLAQLQDQTIAHRNMLFGKLEAYTELLDMQEVTENA